MDFYPLGGGGGNRIRSKSFREAECLSCTDLLVRVSASTLCTNFEYFTTGICMGRLSRGYPMRSHLTRTTSWRVC